MLLSASFAAPVSLPPHEDLLLSQFVEQRKIIDLFGFCRFLQAHIAPCQLSVELLRVGRWSTVESPGALGVVVDETRLVLVDSELLHVNRQHPLFLRCRDANALEGASNRVA